MTLGDAICLVSLPYLVMCGVLYHQIDNTTGRIIKESILCEDDKDQLEWMISAVALPIFLLAPILYFFGMHDQLIHWLIWGKLEARNFENKLIKGG